LSGDLALCVLLWARPGEEAALVAYEDDVLALLADHGAALLQRARSDSTDDQPFEVHILRFPSQDAHDRYMADDRRVALADRRDAAIARTEIIPVDLV
jgi:uncharacterized protein (DUF1330 family)